MNVPADLGPACNLLPILPPDVHIVSLKLKRKLEYKQAYLHDTICPEKVITALHYLKNNNPLHANIENNEDWIRGWQDADNNLYNGAFVSEGDNGISVDSDKQGCSTQKQMPDINCDDAPLNNINESDCDNSDSDSDRAKKNNTNEIEKEDLIALEGKLQTKRSTI